MSDLLAILIFVVLVLIFGYMALELKRAKLHTHRAEPDHNRSKLIDP